VKDLNSWLQVRELMTKIVQQYLLRAQVRMKNQTDKHRSEVSFVVGDRVYIKLQPYIQTSLANRAHQKLAFKFFGPYTIIEKMGCICLSFGSSSRLLHPPCFHVSQLKKWVSTSVPVTTDLPNCDLPYQVSEAVLDTRMVQRGEAEVPQLLIKWSGLDATLATREDKEDIQQQFLKASAWIQADLQDRGSVSAPTDGAKTLKKSFRERRPSTRVHGPEWK
jgi:hypothetical protein